MIGVLRFYSVASRIPTYRPQGTLPTATPASRKEDIAWYMQPRWRALRKIVLREEPICRMCQREASSHVDHIIPRKKRPDLAFERSNLQGLCQPCHNAKKER